MGQRTLQKERLFIIANTITIKRMLSLIIVRVLIERKLFNIKSGIVTCMAAAGQILQKEYKVCSPKKNGNRKTDINNTKYFMLDVCFGISIFRVGILCSISWRNPKGQTHPQNNLPINIPKSKTVPNAKNGNMRYPEKWTNTPIGQANQERTQE